MTGEASGNKTEPKNAPDREQSVDVPNDGKTQEPKVIPLEAREVKESQDVQADRERLTRLLESEER